MQNQTRELFDAYLEHMAQLNGVPDAGRKFSVTPTIQQTLESKIQESSDFLGRINVMGVTEQEGEKLGLMIGSTIASTTDTSGAGERSTQDPTSLDNDGYKCTQTNFDTHLRYSLLDAWAKFADFQTRIRDAIIQRIALDRMMIGWNGTSRAATSDRVANPLLQDVNIGWLQKVRTAKPENVIQEVVPASGAVKVGVLANATKGDFANLDALVFDLVNSLLDPWHREAPGLVAVMGRELLADKYFPLIEAHGDTPTEARALDVMMSSMRVGGLQAVRVPFFPSRSVVITTLDNLSIYYQEGKHRRAIIDNPKKDQIEDYQSSNEAYVVEDHGAFAAAENITLPNADGTAFE